MRAVFQGLRLGSLTLFSVVPDCPNSGVLVLPRMIAPAALTRSTTIESISGVRSRNRAEPIVVGQVLGHLQVLDGDWNAVQRSNGPAREPRCRQQRGRQQGPAPGAGRGKSSTVSPAAQYAGKNISVTSADETCRDLMARLSSVAAIYASSVLITTPWRVDWP